MSDPVPAQLAAIRTMEIGALKKMWRDLNQTEPPPYNRKFLESRLSYRVQELAYGGLKPETLKRLAILAEELLPAKGVRRARSTSDMPCAGTKLVREWKGEEHRVTVLDEGFEYDGRPFRSLSAIARSITGTRWNGLLFFGLKSQRGRA
jgi:hypothetical protein